MKHTIVLSAALIMLGCSAKPPAPTASPSTPSPAVSASPSATANPATASPSPQASEPRPRPNLPEDFFASLTVVREFSEEEAAKEPWFQRGLSDNFMALYTSNQGAEETCKALLPSLQAEGRENHWKGEDWHQVEGSWVAAYSKPGDIWGALVIVTPLPEEGKEFASPLYESLKLPAPGKLPAGPGCLVWAATAYELPPLFQETWPQEP